MSDLQDFTKSGGMSGIPKPYETLTLVQRTYIDYKALDGIITDDDGIRKMSIDELASKLNVSRQALYEGKNHVPNFWDLVAERRKKFNSESRLAYVHKKWYIKAATVNNWPVTEAWLRNNDPNYKEAKAKIEHEMGNSWAALLAGKKPLPEPIEGEVVDANPTD